MCRKCGSPGGMFPDSVPRRSEWLHSQLVSLWILWEIVAANLLTCVQFFFLILLTIQCRDGIGSRPDDNMDQEDFSVYKYPFNYDQLEPEFDQYGRGFFALPASGQNAKNVALRKYDGLGAGIFWSAIAVFVFSLLSCALHVHLHYTRAGTSFWQPGVRIKLCILACGVASILHVGVSAALYIFVQTFASRSTSDQAIKAYLQDVRTRLPDGKLDPVRWEIEPLVEEATAILGISAAHSTVRIVVLLIERVLPTRYRLPTAAVSTSDEEAALVSADNKQRRHYRWKVQGDSVGALERLYTQQQQSSLDSRLGLLPQIHRPGGREAKFRHPGSTR